MLVNVIKGLFALKPNAAVTSPNVASSPAGDSSAIDETQRQEAITKISTLDSSEPLAEMLGRSGRYPILLHEAVVALTLLASNSAGREWLDFIFTGGQLIDSPLYS